MSTIWTPGGERPVGGGEQAGARPDAPATGPEPRPQDQAPAGEASEEELAAHMDELRQQLADAPAELVVANHGFGLFELAALHLSLQPPRLPQARLAIDALAALLDGLAGRLGAEEAQLQEGLASLRLAFVQIQRSAQAPGSEGPGGGGPQAGGPAPGGAEPAP